MRGSSIVAAYDTAGRKLRREPWIPFSLDGLFAIVQRGVTSDDVIEVSFDQRLGYPRRIRVDISAQNFDDWLLVTAGTLSRLP